MTIPSARQIRAEMERAYEALDDAEHTLSEGRLRTALSRAYYAVFHAARAVLWSQGLAPKTHKGMIQLFGKHVVGEGLVSREIGKILTEAHEQRELADYHALAGSFDKDEVEMLVADARRFVEKIEGILK